MKQRYPVGASLDGWFREEVQGLRQDIRKYEGDLAKQQDINILVLGPSTQAKNALTRTLRAAYHNKQQCLTQKGIVQGGWVSKTSLTHNKKYVVQGSKRELQRRNINFLQYEQTVNSKTIGQFSKLFYDFMPSILTPHCSSVMSSTIQSNPKVTVFCFESAMPLTEDEYCYTSLLLSNLQEQGLQPIIILVNIFQPVRWINEKSVIDRKQTEIRNFANGFNIPRDQIYLLQCYREGAELSDQTNFYALQILLTMLRQTDKAKELQGPIKRVKLFCF